MGFVTNVQRQPKNIILGSVLNGKRDTFFSRCYVPNEPDHLPKIIWGRSQMSSVTHKGERHAIFSGQYIHTTPPKGGVKQAARGAGKGGEGRTQVGYSG